MSKNEQRIDNWCMRENFEPTLVLELTRVLLEHFRSGLKISDMFHPNLTEENLKKQKDTMRRDFLEAIRLPMDDSLDLQDSLFQELRDCPWMRPLIEQVLEEIAATVDEGQLYKRIIENYYLNDNPMSNDEMSRTESLSSASIERKKREAIKCFGISIYRYAYRRECEESEKESNNGSK